MASMQMSAVRRKQMLLLAALAGVIVVIAVVAGSFSAPPPKPPAPTNTEVRKSFGAPGGSVDAQSEWRTQEGARVQQLEAQLTDIRKEMAASNAARAASEQKSLDEQREREAARGPTTPLPPQPGSRSVAALGPVGADPGAAPIAPARPAVVGITSIEVSKDATPAVASAGAAAPAAKSNPPRAAGQGAGDGLGYLPTGTYMRLVTLAGADAPTGGQNQSNPVPMLFRVVEFAKLPNRATADLRDCVVTGNGFGELTSERTMVRLDRLACTTESGQAIDVAIKGYISDESGKAGMRGRLITKQGQVLANALLSGLISGLSTAFVQTNSVVSTNPLGSTSTIEPGKEYVAGMAQGVGKAADKLSQYYLTLADKLFPVIETDAGRPVDAVLTQGINLSETP